MEFKPHGVCSQLIKVDVNDGIVNNVEFTGGCNGNLKAIAVLVKGMKVEEAISRLEGITCGYKSTSCPDQLAKALRLASGQLN